MYLYKYVRAVRRYLMLCTSDYADYIHKYTARGSPPLSILSDPSSEYFARCGEPRKAKEGCQILRDKKIKHKVETQQDLTHPHTAP